MSIVRRAHGSAEKAIQRLGLAHRLPEKSSLVAALAEARAPHWDDATGAGSVIRTGEDLLCEEVTQALIEHGTADLHHKALVDKLEPCSTIIVGLRARGDTLGAIALVTTKDSNRRYCQTDLVLAQEIARRAALLIDNARSANAIAVATSQVDRLLQDLLDISLIDSGQLSLQREICDTVKLISEAETLFGPVARRKNVKLACRIDPALPRVFVDRNRILQALSNLLGNAMKFVSEGGQVTLCAETSGSAVRISIEDDGPGIEPEHLALVFDRLWRGPNQKERGVGLGLAVTKGIVEAHGGAIRAERRPTGGSRFYFLLEGSALPCAVATEGGARTPRVAAER